MRPTGKSSTFLGCEMNREISVKINTDSSGFMSQECPACERRFKIKPGEGSDEPVRFCPYCDHTGEACWWTPEQAEYLGATAATQVLGPELDELAQTFNRRTGNSGLFKMTMTVDKPAVPKPPDEPDDAWPRLVFPCCNEEIRHDGENADLFCVICGTELVGETS